MCSNPVLGNSLIVMKAQHTLQQQTMLVLHNAVGAQLRQRVGKEISQSSSVLYRASG